MDRQQIDQLHQQASQQYLEGDFASALVSWQQLLALDPADERAQEGARLCQLMAGGGTAQTGHEQAGSVSPIPRDPADPPVMELQLDPEPGNGGAAADIPPPAASNVQPATDAASSAPAGGTLTDDLNFELDLGHRAAAEPPASPQPDPPSVDLDPGDSGRPGGPSAQERSPAPTASAAASETPIEGELALARAHLASGRIEDAARVCRSVLEVAPSHPEATELIRSCQQEAAGAELDIELSVLDLPSSGEAASSGAIESATTPGEVANPPRQAEAVDLGDTDSVPTLAVGAEVPRDEPQRGLAGLSDMAPEPPAVPAPPVEPSAGLAADAPAPPPAEAPVSRSPERPSRSPRLPRSRRWPVRWTPARPSWSFSVASTS